MTVVIEALSDGEITILRCASLKRTVVSSAKAQPPCSRVHYRLREDFDRLE